MARKKEKKAIPVKEVARTEMQGEKSWWSQPSNLLVVAILSLLTIVGIYFFIQPAAPADEVVTGEATEQENAFETSEGNEEAAPSEEAPAAEEALPADEAAAAAGGCVVLTGPLPEATGQTPTGKPQWSAPFPLLINPECDYRAVMQTSKGTIEIDLFEKEVPNTVNNFVALAQSGYYNGITFHRVIPDFMAQGGDPLGTGGGGPGYSFPDEFSPNLFHNQPGILSMANAGANTNGSQFFITYAPTPHLDGYDAAGQLKNCADPQISCHSVFGLVTSGLEVALSLNVSDGQQAPDVIQSVTITAQ